MSFRAERSRAKNLGVHQVGVTEILRFALNDKMIEKCFDTPSLLPYTPIQLETPKVVAMAVSTVIRMFRILPQSVLLSIV